MFRGDPLWPHAEPTLTVPTATETETPKRSTLQDATSPSESDQMALGNGERVRGHVPRAVDEGNPDKVQGGKRDELAVVPCALTGYCGPSAREEVLHSTYPGLTRRSCFQCKKNHHW